LKQIAGVPRIPPGAVARPRLLAALDDGAPLHVLRSADSGGKTTLMAQWVDGLDDAHTAAWVVLDGTVGSRGGFWVRVLSDLHRGGLIDDATLYREAAAIADSPDAASDSIHRALTSTRGPVDLVLDGFGGPGAHWDDVCRDLLALVARTPTLCCVVAGTFPTLLEGPVAAATVRTHVLRDTDLALTLEEARAVVEAAAVLLEPAAVDSLASREVAHPVSELRHVLEVLGAAGRRLSAADVDGLLPSALRHDLAARVGDALTLEHLGVIALAPYVDAELTARLVPGEDGAMLLDRLERRGLGSWSASDGGGLVFRLTDQARSVAGAQYAAEHGGRARTVQVEVSRWLVARGEDPATAIELALRGGDLDYAEHLAVRALPRLLEDPGRLTGLVAAMPLNRIRRYPFLAVIYALALNARPERQARATALLAAVAAAVKVRMASAPRAERGILYGVETGVWRLLGKRPRMLDSARRAVRELSDARAAPDGPADPGLDASSALAASQAATSLLFGDDLAGARAAFDLLATIAAENRWDHYGNVAACGRAMIDILDGRIDDARRELASVRADAWPQTWLNGYAGALRNVAQAWLHLDDGQPTEALAELALLAPHLDTIEYWEFIAAPRALAEAMLGRAAEAEAHLEQLAAQRIGPTTLPSVQRRLMASRSMLQLATGQARDWPERRVPGRASSVASAMQAVAAAARSQDAEAVALLASAESDTVSPLQQALVAVAGVSVAQRTTSTLGSAPFGVRLAVLATAHGLHWPVTLIADRDREQLLAAVDEAAGPATAKTLSVVLDTVPAIVDERLWRTTSVPSLTPRERDVLRQLARTDNRNEIAAELYVSINTVKAQLRSLYAKLGARTRDDALHRAISAGLLSEPAPAADGSPEDGFTDRPA